MFLRSPRVVADRAVVVIKRGTCQLGSVRKSSDSALPKLFTLACAWSMCALTANYTLTRQIRYLGAYSMTE